MINPRSIHPDFQSYLDLKTQEIIELYCDLRFFILDIYPASNELLYHTHALTSVYSISPKLSDGFCHIPIYTNHLNLGFNKGNLLKDPHQLLQGTGKLIRHIPIKNSKDFHNRKVKNLLQSAIDFAIEDLDKENDKTGLTISKIKRNK